MAGTHNHAKMFDKYEGALFDKLYRCMKYKYEDIIKVLNLYSEVRFYHKTN